jgi:hypothetical protein
MVVSNGDHHMIGSIAFLGNSQFFFCLFECWQIIAHCIVHLFKISNICFASMYLFLLSANHVIKPTKKWHISIIHLLKKLHFRPANAHIRLLYVSNRCCHSLSLSLSPYLPSAIHKFFSIIHPSYNQTNRVKEEVCSTLE